MRVRFVNGLISSVLMILLVSCDCNQNVSGTVIDSETKVPLDSVYAHKATKDYGKYTGKKGEFKLREVDGGLFGCPPMEVVLSRTGYDEKVTTIENAGHEIIQMTRKK